MKKKVGLGILIVSSLYALELVPLQKVKEAREKKAKSSPIVQGKLQVHNKTTIPFFVAIYARPQGGGYAYRISTVERALPEDTVDLNRKFILRIAHKLKYIPVTGKFFELERLVVARKAEDLAEELPVSELDRLIVAKIGLLPHLYIGGTESRLRIFTPIEWQLTYPFAAAIEKRTFWRFINEKRKAAEEQFASEKYPYAARVTEGTRLSVGEQSYLQARTPQVKSALERLLNRRLQDNQVPRIAFCCAGGGYRAMLASLGWFKGAQEIGLLDSATYAAALSGSSWFLAPWISSGFTLNSFQQQLISKIKTNFLKTNLNLPEFKKLLVTKFIFREPISLTDIYGGMLAQKLLGGFTKNPHSITLSGQAERVADGSQIYPLYAAILSGREYEWFEFNPHVTGSDYLKAYVPSWAFGRKFSKGISTNYAPPQSLGFLMGIWGWVIGFKAQDVLEHFRDVIKPERLRKAMVKSSLAYKRITVPVFNYTYGMEGRYGLQEYLALTDAGINFNLALPLVLKKERNVDIIVMLDTTAPPNISINKAVDHARNKGFKLPKVDYEEIKKRNKSCIVYQEDDPSVPTLIYMPLVKNNNYSKGFDPDMIIKQGGYLVTSNLAYTDRDAKRLIGLTEFSMKESKELIVNAINSKIELKQAAVAV